MLSRLFPASLGIVRERVETDLLQSKADRRACETVHDHNSVTIARGVCSIVENFSRLGHTEVVDDEISCDFPDSREQDRVVLFDQLVDCGTDRSIDLPHRLVADICQLSFEAVRELLGINRVIETGATWAEFN